MAFRLSVPFLKHITTSSTLLTSQLLRPLASPILHDALVGIFPRHLHKHVQQGPGLEHFMRQAQETSPDSGCSAAESSLPPSSPVESTHSPPLASYSRGSAVFLETYGCQMNVNDSEVVHSILNQHGFTITPSLENADVILLNTCAIRENAENKIWHRLQYFRSLRRKPKNKGPQMWETPPVVGVLGCMAERLKHKLLEQDQLVDLVAGPDAYRDLPRLISAVRPAQQPDQQSEDDVAGSLAGQGAINVQLSTEETYADVIPVRSAGALSAYVSVMRGCNNMCAFCIVPFTRGRERSRPVASILNEVRALSEKGFKEVTLLGQNVNSFADNSEMGSKPALNSDSENHPFAVYAKGFTSVYKPKREEAVRFAELIDRVADIDPEMRIRFTSPHPKDFPDELLQVMSSRSNVCSQIHMPAQSGSSTCLQRMRRGYTREAYLDLVEHIRDLIPNVGISSDFITGFCGETEAEHEDTLSLLETVGYDTAYLFAYSLREKTQAARHLKDDVPEEVKSRRLQEMNATFRAVLAQKNKAQEGTVHLVLVEGKAKRAETGLKGRTDSGRMVIFPDLPVPTSIGDSQAPLVGLAAGDYAIVKIDSSAAGSLHGTPLARSNISEFYSDSVEFMMPTRRAFQ